MSVKEMDFVVKNLPKEKTPGQTGFTGKFHETQIERILEIVPNLFQKIGVASNSFYEASTILMLKSEKNNS